MMSVDFEEANFTYGKPESMTDEQCSSIRVFKGEDTDGFPVIISKWQPNKEDIEAIMRGEPIYLSLTSPVLVPVSLFTEYPFVNL